MAKATHVVVHPKQYLSVGGKLQHMPKGTELTLTAAQAESLEKKGRVARLGSKEAVDLTQPPADEPVAKAAGSKA